MDLPQSTELYQLLLYVLEKFVAVSESAVKSISGWFDVLTTKM